MRLETRIALFLLIALMITAQASSQVEIPGSTGGEVKRSVFGIGLAGGPVSGIGLSFRHHLPAPMSYQITGGVIKVDETVYYSVGGEFQYDFILETSSRIFAVVGVGYYHSGTANNNEIEGPGRAGIGVGGEFKLFGSFHGIAEGMFTYFTDGTILPLPQVGIFYYFL